MSVTTRWVDGLAATDDEWKVIDHLLESRGWMSLNRMTSRVLLAERGEVIVGFSVVQLFPGVGPLYVRPASRGTDVAASLADMTMAWLQEIKARGWMVVADSPFTVKLCEARGMERLESPVYVTR